MTKHKHEDVAQAWCVLRRDAAPGVVFMNDRPLSEANARALAERLNPAPPFVAVPMDATAGAAFRVVRISPEGSGMDYADHLGLTVAEARRCCRNCTVIFGRIGRTEGIGPFIPGELEPLNEPARLLQEEIEAFRRERGKEFTG